jgi:RNA polymerase sigma factor (sigma-70 family)
MVDEEDKESTQWHTRVTLLQRVKDQHDAKAWEEFVFYYRRYVYNIARRMNLNHHDAEEVVQTVMLKLWKKLPEFEYDSSKGRFRGWLCRVCGNEVKMFIRKRQRRAATLDRRERQAEESYLKRVELPDIENLAEKEWVVYITSLAWDSIQDHFDDKTKKAFELLSKGMSGEEVAEELEISRSSAYVYKKRVQDRLRIEIMRLNRELD